MTDTKISSSSDSTLQDSKKQTDVRTLVNRVRERQGLPPIYPQPVAEQPVAERVAPEPSAVHVQKEQQPTSTDDMTAEIIALNRQIIDEFTAFDDDNTYTVVENYCLDNPNLGGREMAVYATLARYCHMPKRTCKVSIARLSERLGWKRDTINKALDNLVKFGLIERGERDIGGAYTYTLTHRHRSKKKEKKAA